MRFFLDQDVNAAVAKVIRDAGHNAWSAFDAGLAESSDDDLTVYADDKQAILVTRDREFSQRRRRNVRGKHLWLDCGKDSLAAPLLLTHLQAVVEQFTAAGDDDLWMRLHAEGADVSRVWD